jgi:hypothetical protein
MRKKDIGKRKMVREGGGIRVLALVLTCEVHSNMFLKISYGRNVLVHIKCHYVYTRIPGAI